MASLFGPYEKVRTFYSLAVGGQSCGLLMSMGCESENVFLSELSVKRGKVFVSMCGRSAAPTGWHFAPACRCAEGVAAEAS